MIGLGNYDEALNYMNQYIEKNPEDGNGFFVRGFIYEKKKHIFSMNIPNFYKNIKIIDKDDYITLIQDDDEMNYMNILIKNIDPSKKYTTIKMKLLDFEEEPRNFEDSEVDAKIVMKSQEFHKICREMNLISEYVDLRCTPKVLIFKCGGDNADRTSVYGNENDYINEISFTNKTEMESNQLVSGIFSLKHLVSFTKFQSLSTDVEIFMKNDAPLVLRYVLPIGRLILCITPQGEIEDTFENAEKLY